MEERILLTYRPFDQSEKVVSTDRTVDNGIEVVRSELMEATTGSPLNVHDVLFMNAAERSKKLAALAEAYGLPFTQSIEYAPGGVSLTSLKCIVTTEDGGRFFLKQKAEYCSDERQLERSASFQEATARGLGNVPAIVRTTRGEPHAAIGRNSFLLTPYIEGEFFMGRIEQSVSCAETLARMHVIGMGLEKKDAQEINSHDEAVGWIERLSAIDTSDNAMKTNVTLRMKEIADRNRTRNTGRTGWLHGDFAPYNMVFDVSDSLIAANDFDNVAYGPLSRDVAECIMTHCGIMYAGPSSSMRPPICTVLDEARGKAMLERYRSTSGLGAEELSELREQLSLIWLELLSLGLVRGDFSFGEVHRALENYSSVKGTIDILSDYSSSLWK